MIVLVYIGCGYRFDLYSLPSPTPSTLVKYMYEYLHEYGMYILLRYLNFDTILSMHDFKIQSVFISLVCEEIFTISRFEI